MGGTNTSENKDRDVHHKIAAAVLLENFLEKKTCSGYVYEQSALKYRYIKIFLNVQRI